MSVRLVALHICCHIKHCPSTEDSSFLRAVASVCVSDVSSGSATSSVSIVRKRFVFSKTLFYGMPSAFVNAGTVTVRNLKLWKSSNAPISL